MHILSAAYADPEQSAIDVQTDDGSHMLVPWPSSTWHREHIEDWLAAGNAIAPYVAPTVPVPEASPLQLFDELDQTHGIDLEAEIEALNPKALRRFRLSNRVRRTDPVVVTGLQPKLGWTDAQVDALFRAAATR